MPLWQVRPSQASLPTLHNQQLHVCLLRMHDSTLCQLAFTGPVAICLSYSLIGASTDTVMDLTCPWQAWAGISKCTSWT